MSFDAETRDALPRVCGGLSNCQRLDRLGDLSTGYDFFKKSVAVPSFTRISETY
jgi:hypothetical protein